MAEPDSPTRIRANHQVVEQYPTLEGTWALGAVLADDVEWADGVPTSGVVTHGQAPFLANFGDDEPRSEVHRIIEENDVVVAEGTAHVMEKDGTKQAVRFVHVLELADGKMRGCRRSPLCSR